MTKGKGNYYVFYGIFWGLWQTFVPFQTYGAALNYAKKLNRKWKIVDDEKNIIDNSENYQN